MTQYTINASGPIRLPTGITVGDEFRIAGKVRVTAIFEDLIDVTSFTDDPQRLAGGSRSYTLTISDIEPVE